MKLKLFRLSQSLLLSCMIKVRKFAVKFSYLILGKIVKIVSPDFKAKCTKFDFGWGSAPNPAGGAYNAPQTHS